LWWEKEKKYIESNGWVSFLCGGSPPFPLNFWIEFISKFRVLLPIGLKCRTWIECENRIAFLIECGIDED
jgi:hypothetical protein